jgi:hypothetical protein
VLLVDAYQLLDKLQPTAAIARAAAAFESTLRGYLHEQGILQDIDQTHLDEKFLSVPYMINGLFKQAVRQDPEAKVREFDPKLKARLLGVTGQPQPGIQQIRNVRVHTGYQNGIDTPEGLIALVSCDTYSECVRYIIEKGWRTRDTPMLTSEGVTWMHEALDGHVFPVPESTAVNSMRKGLERALSYLHPIERQRLKDKVKPSNWAYPVLHR